MNVPAPMSTPLPLVLMKSVPLTRGANARAARLSGLGMLKSTPIVRGSRFCVYHHPVTT